LFLYHDQKRDLTVFETFEKPATTKGENATAPNVGKRGILIPKLAKKQFM